MASASDFSDSAGRGTSGEVLSGRQLVDAVTRGTSITTVVNPGGAATIAFPRWGDIGYRILPNQNMTLSVSGGNAEQIQVMRLFIQQPFSGNCDVTWPDNIIWPDGKMFVDSRSGAVCCAEIIWDGMANYYGRRIFG